MILIYVVLIIIQIKELFSLNKFERKKQSIFKRNAIYANNHRNFFNINPIQYYISSTLDESKIEEAIQILESKTCLQFKKQRQTVYGDKGFNYVKNNECHTTSGPEYRYKFIEENIYLNDECSQSVGRILQLTGQMLGLISCVKLSNRNKFVTINEDNLDEKSKNLFNKVDLSVEENYKTSFDFGSGLLYKSTQYSKNKNPVIIPKNSFFYDMMGQEYGLSFNDYKVLNNFYCSSNCINKPNICLNGGYLNPNNCRECLCSNGYGGIFCHIGASKDAKCLGDFILVSPNFVKNINLKGKMTCSYAISSSFKTKIKIKVISVFTEVYSPCYEKMGLEVKYFADQGATGLCLCGKFDNITLISETNIIMIEYNGMEDNNYVNIELKQII
uniref:Astacin domain-containing protein n=1 Tax=Parastrongyloides trichosuri TaxID=131310 RepID=A0A0N5A3B4_PARTI